jgi:citrate/tricarballylate utilization protein
MPATEAVESARRALEICKACRYCDDYCVVFRAIDGRRDFSRADLFYLANLCHNCSNCYYACQYAPPHEFDINLPRRFAQIRAASWRHYGWPRFLAGLFPRNGVFSLGVVALVLAFTLAATLGLEAPQARFSPHLGPGAFYAIVPWKIMALVAGASLGLSLLVLAAGLVRFWRDLEHFQAKWIPVRVKKMRKNKNLEHFHVSMKHENTLGAGPARVSIRALRTALFDVLTLRNLGGGGPGCNDFDEALSLARRRFHHLMFYGFALCLASTAVATLYDHLLGWPAPYPLSSLPVALGGFGGLGMIVGAGGLAWIKIAGDPAPTASSLLGGDYALLGVLTLVAASGLLLLAFRETGAISALLAVHLGAVLAFFLLLPFGKFVHGFYRAAALLRAAMDQGEDG